eukprot:SAG31_NODE_5296_length_2626_cov_3.550851_2_plen_278_part_00
MVLVLVCRVAGSTNSSLCCRPWLEHPLGCQLESAVAIGYSGLDIYGFHALEALQCMVERRHGGEVGLAAVQCLEGEAVWRAAREGAFEMELAEAAVACIDNKPAGGIMANTPDPACFLLEYRDGFRAAVLMLDGYVSAQAYAARLGGNNGAVVACEMHLKEDSYAANGQMLPPRPAEGTFPHFAYLGRCFEEMVLTGAPPYPVERCLLTTGALEAALTSRFEGHRRLPTPWLDVRYESYAVLPPRPVCPRPQGAAIMAWPPGRIAMQAGKKGSAARL